jgi:hypothetical protein
MPFIALGGVTLDLTSFEETEPLAVGDRYEAFDGSDRTSVFAYKRRFRGTTRPLTEAEHTTYRAAILATPPIAATGDALGTMDVSARIVGAPYLRTRDGFERVIELELRER